MSKAVAIAAGLAAFVIVGGLLLLGLRLVWPGYEAAYPMRNFDTPMRIARLFSGAAAAIAAGAAAARIAGQTGRADLIVGVILLAVSASIHLTDPVWSQYPLWYHAVYLGSLVPLTLFGGRLARRIKASS